MKIAYLRRSPPHYPRLTKECNSLVRLGHRVTYIGWDPTPREKRPHELHPDVELRVLELEMELGRPELLKSLRWYWFMLRSLGFRRFDAVHCVDEEAAVMLAPFKHVLFRYLVMDVYDSIIKRKASTPLHAWVFRSIRWLANSVSDRIIETSEELRETLGKFQSKAVVIFNSPEDPGASVQGILPPTDGPLLMALGGSINMRRMALEPLVRVLDRLGPEKILVMSSGQLTDDYSRQQWVKHPCVRHRWLDSSAEYFRQLAECDVVHGVRADAEDSLYRSLVFPQKVFDAVAVGRPVLVATENWVAGWLKQRELGYSCSFRDDQAMERILMECRERRAQLPAFAARARELYLREFDWKRMEERLAALYRQLQQR